MVVVEQLASSLAEERNVSATLRAQLQSLLAARDADADAMALVRARDAEIAAEKERSCFLSLMLSIAHVDTRFAVHQQQQQQKQIAVANSSSSSSSSSSAAATAALLAHERMRTASVEAELAERCAIEAEMAHRAAKAEQEKVKRPKWELHLFWAPPPILSLVQKQGQCVWNYWVLYFPH